MPAQIPIELDHKTKLRLKSKYIRAITQQMGWKVMYDGDPELADTFYDFQMMLTKKENNMQLYGFFQIPNVQDISIYNFAVAMRTADTGNYAHFLDKVYGFIYPYDIDDVIAQCLHLGYHLEDVYQNNGKKLNLVLDEEKVMVLIKTFAEKGSPLVNAVAAARPKKIKDKTKTFFNPDQFKANPAIAKQL